jgi:hypothetical protein
MRRVGEAEAFEPDIGPTRAVEQPDAVAEQDGRVHTRISSSTPASRHY